MKTKTHLSKRTAALWLSSLFLFVALTACDNDKDDEKVNNSPYNISGDASGSQMVPSVSGTGTGTISGSFDPSTRNLTYTSNWNGLTGAPTSGGFYSGASGASGTAVGTPWSFDSTATATGSTTGTMTLTAEQAQQLTSGNWYYSYGTEANTGGEVRGQIAATR
jgi:hypothetical protein